MTSEAKIPAEKTTAPPTARSAVRVRLGNAITRCQERVTGASSASDCAELVCISMVDQAKESELRAHQLLVGAYCLVAERERHFKRQIRLLSGDHRRVNVGPAASHQSIYPGRGAGLKRLHLLHGIPHQSRKRSAWLSGRRRTTYL